MSSERHLKVTLSPSVTGTAGLSRMTGSPGRGDGLVPPMLDYRLLSADLNAELTGYCDVHAAIIFSRRRLTPVNTRVCLAKSANMAGSFIPATCLVCMNSCVSSTCPLG